MKSEFKKHLPQIVRRTIQLTAFAFIVYTAFGGAWRNFKRAHNQARIVGLLKGETVAKAYDLNDKFLASYGDGKSYDNSFDFLGMPWASTLGGIESIDPLLLLSQVATHGSMPWALLIGLLIPVGLALLAGKFFCSHICPMRLTFEIGEFVRAALLRFGVDLPEWTTKDRFGGWVLIGGLVAAVLAGPAVWLFILPYVSLGAGIFLLVTTSTVSLLFGVVAFWLVVDIFFAPGFFCHNVCPTGFLLEKIGRFRIWRLRTKPDSGPCPQNCEVCSMTCPYGLSSKDENYEPACDNCGRCAVNCPLEKLGRRVGSVVAVLLLLLAPMSAQAHHNKGLPHYGYFENYPQVPTEEYVMTDGKWELGGVIFNFQGYDDRANSDTPNDVKLYLYIYDLEKDDNYTKDVDFEIRRPDGTKVAEYLRTKVDEEAVYSTRETLPESGTYHVIAHLDTNPPKELVLPIYVELADDGVNGWLLAAIGFPVLLVFGLAVVGRKTGRLKNRNKKKKENA